MKKDKFIRDFKIYNFVMTNVWQLLTTILIGFGIGWVAEKFIDTEKNLFIIFSIVIAIFIGIINFFYALYKKMKQLQKTEEKQENIQYNKFDEENDEDNSK